MTERILVVDDHAFVREIICHMLAIGGYRCRAVASGEQALELLNAGEQVDLVTTDIMNAPLDGISFLGQIKHSFSGIPVVMITALHDMSLVLGCIKDGAFDYLFKPFGRGQLLNVVERALRNVE